MKCEPTSLVVSMFRVVVSPRTRRAGERVPSTSNNTRVSGCSRSDQSPEVPFIVSVSGISIGGTSEGIDPGETVLGMLST
jgi:hypothetical protein